MEIKTKKHSLSKIHFYLKYKKKHDIQTGETLNLFSVFITIIQCFVFAGNFVFIIKRLCVSFICLLRLLKSTKTVHNYLNFYHLAQSDRININSIVMEMNCLYCFSRKFEPQFVLTTRLKVTLKQIIKIANNKKFGFAC